MFNPIAFTNEAQITASTTLGYAPGQTTPPQLLFCNNSGGITVTLPPVQTTLVQPPTTSNPTVGSGGGYRITVFAQTSNAITIAAAGSDTITPATTLTGSANAVATFQASPLLGGWFKVA